MGIFCCAEVRLELTAPLSGCMICIGERSAMSRAVSVSECVLGGFQ